MVVCRYVAEATRDDAEAFVKANPAGTFLVRPSSKENCLTMTCHTEGGGVAHVLLQRAAAPRTGWTVEGDSVVHDSVAGVLKSQRSIRFPPPDAVKKAFDLKWPRAAPPAPLYAQADQLPTLNSKTTTAAAAAASATATKTTPTHAAAAAATPTTAAPAVHYADPVLKDDNDYVHYDDVDSVAEHPVPAVDNAPITVRSPLGNFTLKRGDLVLGDVLGRGAFGFVKKATLGEQQVAVKQVLVSGRSERGAARQGGRRL
jgi:hypothetical protein